MSRTTLNTIQVILAMLQFLNAGVGEALKPFHYASEFIPLIQLFLGAFMAGATLFVHVQAMDSIPPSILPALAKASVAPAPPITT